MWVPGCHVACKEWHQLWVGLELRDQRTVESLALALRSNMRRLM